MPTGKARRSRSSGQPAASSRAAPGPSSRARPAGAKHRRGCGTRRQAPSPVRPSGRSRFPRRSAAIRRARAKRGARAGVRRASGCVGGATPNASATGPTTSAPPRRLSRVANGSGWTLHLRGRGQGAAVEDRAAAGFRRQGACPPCRRTRARRPWRRRAVQAGDDRRSGRSGRGRRRPAPRQKERCNVGLK